MKNRNSSIRYEITELSRAPGRYKHPPAGQKGGGPFLPRVLPVCGLPGLSGFGNPAFTRVRVVAAFARVLRSACVTFVTVAERLRAAMFRAGLYCCWVYSGCDQLRRSEFCANSAEISVIY